MREIRPYTIQPGAFIAVMPKGARILSITTRETGEPSEWATRATPILWVLADPGAILVHHRFITIAAEQPLPAEFEKMEFIGSFTLFAGKFVGHVFDAGEAEA